MEYKDLFAAIILSAKIWTSRKKSQQQEQEKSEQPNNQSPDAGKKPHDNTPNNTSQQPLVFGAHHLQLDGTRPHHYFNDIGIICYFDFFNPPTQPKPQRITATKIELWMDDKFLLNLHSKTNMEIAPNHTGQVRIQEYIHTDQLVRYWNNIVQGGTPLTIHIKALAIVEGKTVSYQQSIFIEDIIDHIRMPKIGMPPSESEIILENKKRREDERKKDKRGLYYSIAYYDPKRTAYYSLANDKQEYLLRGWRLVRPGDTDKTIHNKTQTIL